MIPRKRLDISGRELLAAAGQVFVANDPDRISQGIALSWPGECAVHPVLSVRSGLDATLSALGFEEGDEILFSAVTIGDMARVVQAHGLIPVPVDIDRQTLSLDTPALENAVTAKTRAILVAHLFGSRMPMDPVIAVARSHGMTVIEDCAQAFTGDGFGGHPDSDVVMFSFGPIKTATALGGGVLLFRSSDLHRRVRQIESTWPEQGHWAYLRRILKYALLVFASRPAVYAWIVRALRLARIDHDRFASARVRGFPVTNLLAHLRRRPSAPLLALLSRRLRTYPRERIEARRENAEAALSKLPPGMLLGACCDFHSHWVLPVLSTDPGRLVPLLWEQGVDATRGSTSLTVIECEGDEEAALAQSRDMMCRILYLPLDPSFSKKEMSRIGRLAAELDRSQ